MKLSNITKILHIIIALTMICLLAVGIYMEETEAFFLYPIHKSIGAIIFVVAIIRIVVRIKEGWPDAIGATSKAQLFIAKSVHWVLITLTIVYPASGLMMSGAGGHGIYIFGLELVASNYDQVTGDAIALNEGVASLGHTLHGSLVEVLIALIVLHVVGALKHHFVDKDETITRMFSFK